MNKIKLLVLFSKFVTPVLSYSTEELQISPASTDEARIENWMPVDLSVDPHPM